MSTIDLRPSRDLVQAEQKAANKLTQAEQEDDARKAAVAAGTSQPPGPSERPYLEDARGRAPIHAESAAALEVKVGEATARQEAAEQAADALEAVDAEADPLEKQFWNQWLAIAEPNAKGRLRFYPTGARSDYGNPSYSRNRAWWDAAAANLRDTSLVLPEVILTFRDRILTMAGRYGAACDRVTSADQALTTSWKELVNLGRQARKLRRKTRLFLSVDFDDQPKWVDELVAPPASIKRKPTEGQPS